MKTLFHAWETELNKCIRFTCYGVMVALLAGGCADGPPTSAPVNPNIARETLTAAMDSWKFGETPESMAELTPPVVVSDRDWTDGFKLLDYEVVDASKEVNANLYAKVKLTLEDPKGEKSEKTVDYVIGTSPKLTVFRDAFQ